MEPIAVSLLSLLNIPINSSLVATKTVWFLYIILL